MARSEAPSINILPPPPTQLHLELDTQEDKPETLFTVQSVDSSPVGPHSPSHATSSSFLNPNNHLTTHRNSLNKHRNSLDTSNSLAPPITQEEMIRNKKYHKGKIYRTLTLEESSYYDDYVFCNSSDGEVANCSRKTSFGEAAARKIEMKRHRYVYTHYVEKVILYASVILLGALSVILLVAGKFVLAPIPNEKSLAYTTFDSVRGELLLERGTNSIQCSLFSAAADNIPPVKYDEEGEQGVRLRYNYTDSSFVLSESLREDGVCSHIFWEAYTQKTLLTSLEICFSLMDGQWFGGYESYSQQWPLNYTSTPFYKPYLSTDYTGQGEQFGPVLHPAWFSSEGAVVMAETDESYLHLQLKNVSDSETQLCLRASFDGYLLSSSSEIDLHLNVTLCLFDNILLANKFFLQQVLTSPENSSVSHTPPQIFPDPIWSTWDQYRTTVSQENVQQLLDNILNNGFNASTIQIDDTYSSSYGDFDFDTIKFPNPVTMIENIHDKYINVSVWIHPFGNIDSDVFQESLSQDATQDAQDRWMFCRRDNHTLGVVRWWRGYGGLIDFTKQTTFDWLLERLNNFSLDYSIDSFKFDAGESTYLPQCDLSLHPNKYSQLYVDLASRFTSSQVQVGYATQRFPMIVALLDKEHTWGLDNGLHSVLTSTLTLSVLGYPFVLPGSIGGSDYRRDVLADSNPSSDVIDEELFTRWVGLNAFLPFMQFSKLPWKYGDDVRDFALRMTRLHYKLVQEIMEPIGRQFLSDQEPIIRPLWWSWPLDPRTYSINTQFLVGDDLMVAPALYKGQTQCPVYFPANSGPWLDARNATIYPTTEEGKDIMVSCAIYETPPYFRIMHGS